jgi:hypothetical protein
VENKYLTQMPDFNFQSFVFGSFTTDFEQYSSEQFALRSNWITIKAASELASGKKENNGRLFLREQRWPGCPASPLRRAGKPDVQAKIGYINSFCRKGRSAGVSGDHSRRGGAPG